MIKLTFCVTRKPEISEEDFHDYWLNNHGPLVKSVRKDLHIAKYIQTHAINTPANEATAAVRGAPVRYDGIAELWWENEEALAKAGSPEGQAASALLLEDEAKMIDFSKSPLWYNQEHVIFDETE